MQGKRSWSFGLIFTFFGALSGLLGLGTTGCMKSYLKSVGGDAIRVHERIFLTDFNTAWQAAIDALKTKQLNVSNRESGFIETKWVDNTAEKNFAESSGTTDVYLKAQYRIQINISKGYYNGVPSTKIAVRREQLVQRDVLDGWVPIESDDIEEKTLLYRLGRIILIRMKIAKIEEEKAKALEAAF